MKRNLVEEYYQIMKERHVDLPDFVSLKEAEIKLIIESIGFQCYVLSVNAKILADCLSQEFIKVSDQIKKILTSLPRHNR